MDDLNALNVIDLGHRGLPGQLRYYTARDVDRAFEILHLGYVPASIGKPGSPSLIPVHHDPRLADVLTRLLWGAIHDKGESDD